MPSIRKLVSAAAVVAIGVATTAATAQAARTTSDPYARPQADGIISVLIAGVTDGTSNTLELGARAAAPTGFSIDVGTSERIASDGLGADFV